MTDANRLRVSSIREVTPGTTPSTPRMRTARITGEAMEWSPNYIENPEMRSDRMLSDPAKVGETNAGPLNYVLSYPVPDSHLSDAFQSAFYNDWVNTPTRFNDGTADSVITDVDNGTQVVTCATGAAFVVGHLVAFSGFGVAANGDGEANAPVLRRCTTGSATVPAFAASSLADEAAPPATARMKVVGFQGASGDITAAAGGLASTTLDLTTLGIVPGMWLKVGGTGAGFRFATELLNTWVRCSGTPTATSIPCDNLPVGWTTDNGSGKTIRVFFGDYLRNGVTPHHLSIEKAFLGQTVPSYFLHKGQVASGFTIGIEDQNYIALSANYLGLAVDIGTSAYGSTYDAETDNRAMTANAHVARMSEGGAAIIGPSWIKSFSISIDNGGRANTVVGSAAPAYIGHGANKITVAVPTYFGDLTFVNKLINGTVSNLGSIQSIDNQAVIFSLPRVTFSKGAPKGEGKDTDVMLPLEGMISKDPLTACQIQTDRVEYFEA